MSALELTQIESFSQRARELWCESCGYGIFVRREPPECPMCRESSWREQPLLARCG
jgi:rubrerythrin